MVAISEVRAQLGDIKKLGSGLVAVFVGGTSGIGESTAREFVRYSIKPRVYLLGRNQEQAKQITSDCLAVNPESQIEFLQCDASLLRDVDRVCAEIKKKEERVNLLFLSAGYMTIKGRDETPEGLDKKFSLHYYSRLRFTQNLLPLLTKATTSPLASSDTSTPPMARVISVLAAGYEVSSLNTSDLSLKQNFTLKACADYATTMNTLAFQQLATTNPSITFIHSAPGGVSTNLMRELPRYLQVGINVLGVLIKPFMTSVEESGQRHLWLATSSKFAGGGAYRAGQTGEKPGNEKVMEALRASGAKETVWGHTEEVFGKVCGDGGKY